MAVLNGWALNSWYGIDHTYVTSSDGHIWKCWGRSSGGNLICSGEGNSRQADCISQNKSHAGLIYGITGVCHQTANRILFPAGCIVSSAKNYWITSFIYGTYGIMPWSSFINRVKSCSRFINQVSDFRVKETEHTPEKDYLSQINSLYLESPSLYREQTLLPARELKITINYRLGADVSSKVIDLLVSHQTDLLSEKRNFDHAFYNKRLSPEKYSDSINYLAQSLLKKLTQSIGTSNYEKLFGLKPNESFYVIDPELMFNSSKK